MLWMMLKQCHDVKYVYVWHALAGYWGGVKPAATGMEHYDTAHSLSGSVTWCYRQPTWRCYGQPISSWPWFSSSKEGFQLHNELHAYLASYWVDGVKLTFKTLLKPLVLAMVEECLSPVAITKLLRPQLQENFPDNGCICMHNTDGIYSAKQTAVVSF
ncbi:GALACTINOL--SUCROSE GALACTOSYLTRANSFERASE 6-RELATED [Salix purpurea]|uniref:GALACTINOL--SUCROSE GALACTOSYLTRANSFERASE 6-RELATED n=1 Tax=Salix purpurea TaxID=77065 RepID=A0A9Q0VWI9_SALPP|nr:GALACTINOL--SUCROSE GALACTOSYLTRANSFERASE 6-RELATED [Salix purpurea]